MSLIRYSVGMGKQQLVGPVTTYIAGELRAERARKGWTLDEVAAATGVNRSTVDRALKGQTAIAVEVLIQLCVGLGLDPAKVLDQASKHR